MRLYTHTHTHTSSFIEKEENRKLWNKSQSVLSKTDGITLVALVVTIVILLILSGVTISVLLGDNGILNKAEEASVKTKFAKIQEELDLYVAAKMVKNFNFDVNTLNAYTTEDSLNYNTKPEEEKGNIKTILSATKYDDLGIFEITNGKLLYTANNKKLAQWAKEVGLLVNLYEIDENGTLLSAETNKTLTDGTGGILTIPDTIKGKKVTSIGEGAFGLTEGVTKVILPKGVTEIQKNAFRGNTTLREIELPEGLLTIGEYAFADCTALESMWVPDTVTDIGQFAFSQCTSFNNIKLSNNMKIISFQVFAGTAITKIEIPEGVVEIQANILMGCKLEYIKIPSTVSKMDNNSIPKNVKTVDIQNNPYFSFNGGMLLNAEGTEIYTITDGAYEDEGKTLKIPYKVEKLNITCANSVHKLKLPSSIKTLSALGSNVDNVEFYNELGEIVTQTEYFLNKNGQICNSEGSILYHCYLINNTEIELNEGIQVINTSAFQYCQNVTSLKLPLSLTTLKTRAMFQLVKLTSLELSANVTNIEEGAFGYNYGLTNIIIANDNPKYMAENGAIYTKDSNGDKIDLIAFIDYSATAFSVPNGIKTIGNRAFTGKNKLESIEIKDGVTSIGNSAFSSCTKLITVTIPNSVTTIEGNAFNQCNTLKKIIIPEGVTTIGMQAFYQCNELETVQISSTVTSIGNNAFLSCGKLKTVEIKRKKNAISGSPWGLATGNAGIKWTGDK